MGDVIAQMPGVRQGIFLVGCPRSGTTLLQSLLASHPAICSFPESHYLLDVVGTPVWRWFDGTVFPVPSPWRRLRTELRIALGISTRKPMPGKEAFFEDLGISRPSQTPMLLSSALRTFAGWMDDKAAQGGHTFWLEKTPDHVCYLDLIDRYIPTTRVIHLFRRGEDVVASLYDAAKRYPEIWRDYEDIHRGVAHWNKTIKWSMRFVDRPNHIIVNYHRVVEQPRYEIRRILGWLHPRLLETEVDSVRREVAEQVIASEPWKAGVASEIRSESRFEQLFTEGEQKTIRESLVSTARLDAAAVAFPVGGQRRH